ncbi:hypothetical protein ABIF65_003761 [Bradyrhizobium japonicum]|jgi:hypothetical protein|uniref:Uncharacterized protein n=1 Tax=Bradyrhizobium japonicum TaxID=375 RepID=A0A0A3XKJ9_BRAJP|nr:MULTISPECIES: hypothetical protein [Bradyrhizobium]KGT73676.1 hypothetical protein MA20_42750 [Bradyrhizobium japonicum]MBR0879510.1 hypothetical protein [Bradyrhizobium liaoningense]MBR0998756.1 hypothetical protein [Bradyrhizobium liaoningense]MBR1030037.1 hypothetical protein [Bradyrhizobium liaoningense]MBR1066907.1 hypothetical protein [Bradyrhizobium liaoningense]
MIEAILYPSCAIIAGSIGYVVCSLINGSEKEYLRERCGELENALDDAGRTLLCHGFRHAAQQAMKALGRPVLEDAEC